MTTIFLDESGDLGWVFNKPYRAGGSSRHLSIAAVVLDPAFKHHPKRLIVDLQKRLKKPPGEEIKWAELSADDRLWFAQKIVGLRGKIQGAISIHAITVRKQNVQDHIRRDPNKLYNYMVNLFLTKEMAKHPSVQFIPDQRAIKVKSGNSMHDYLQTQLWFEHGAQTVLDTKPMDSKTCYGLQLADMVAGMVQSCVEDGKNGPFKVIAQHITHRMLF